MVPPAPLHIFISWEPFYWGRGLNAIVPFNSCSQLLLPLFFILFIFYFFSCICICLGMILIIWSRGKLNISFSLKFWLQFWPFNYLFLSLNFFLNSYLPSSYFNVSIFRWSLCHFYEIIRLLLCFFSGLYFPPKHYGKNIRSASGFFIAGNPFVKIPGFPF